MKKSKDIIYIEDEAYAFKDRIDMLEEELGYSVTPVEDVDVAVKELEEYKYKLILLDIMMPPGSSFENDDVKGGFETGVALARKIKKGRNKETPIIVVTANPELRVKNTLESLGVRAYLTKPINQVELEEKISEALKG